ncbi:peptide deformylase [Pseudophaeobacter profundi]|uniref:peptide deformylase n=1 Tax=Pseudophaeobacter profundi TaxID=3034152 RepID=UPI00242AA297|nr:peptide deformylase [Pseudophaeobacter profundi]
MALLPIVQWPDPGLSTHCAAVGDEDLTGLIADMFDTMYDAPGRGLAAPQVGVLKRLFVMDVSWKEGAPAPLVMINPEILSFGEAQQPGEEGCLSIPGVLVAVQRPTTVTLRWQDAGRAWQQGRFDGFAARCIQHEYDHLDGLVTFDRLGPAARAEAEGTYRRTLESSA